MISTAALNKDPAGGPPAPISPTDTHAPQHTAGLMLTSPFPPAAVSRQKMFTLLIPAAFFAWGCALIDHSGWPEFKRKMRVDFLPTLTAEVSIWPIVQSVNFSVVPLKHQLLVINVFTIMDAAFMSWARNQEDWVTKVMAALQLGSSSSSKATLEMQPLTLAAGGSKGSKGQ